MGRQLDVLAHFSLVVLWLTPVSSLRWGNFSSLLWSWVVGGGELDMGPVIMYVGAESAVWMSVFWHWTSDIWRWVLVLENTAAELKKSSGSWGLDVLKLSVHEIVVLVSILWDQWFLELLVDLWLVVDGSWFGSETLRMSGVLLTSIMWIDLHVHEIISVLSILWNKRFFELLMNLWFVIDRSWLGSKSLWVSSMGLATIVRVDCYIHEIIGIFPVFGNQWFLELLMNFRFGVN
jgi:hypothetical protein